MILYRICQTYPPDHNPLDGMGSFKKGGRWNSKGTFAVYTASSLALARAEMARHISMECIPEGFRVYEIEIPDGDYAEISPLPAGWDYDPPAPFTQRLGDSYLNQPEILAVKVPSVCDPASFNYLLNPESKRFRQVRIVRDNPFVP